PLAHPCENSVLESPTSGRNLTAPAPHNNTSFFTAQD
ncbi:MAG: hypothetical protein ACI8P0_005976, partial [Planctomycetaceae bacterium]